MLILGAAVALAAAVATTGAATRITPRSAVLHGRSDATNADSAALFRFGTTRALAGSTAPVRIHPGSLNVVRKVTGLKPGRRYYFQLVVIQGYPATGSYGRIHSFRTKRA